MGGVSVPISDNPLRIGTQEPPFNASDYQQLLPPLAQAEFPGAKIEAEDFGYGGGVGVCLILPDKSVRSIIAKGTVTSLTPAECIQAFKELMVAHG